jgi:hypothetical protein
MKVAINRPKYIFLFFWKILFNISKSREFITMNYNLKKEKLD